MYTCTPNRGALNAWVIQISCSVLHILLGSVSKEKYMYRWTYVVLYIPH